MKAIPAIDLIDGKVVRLFQGDFSQQTSYAADPVDYAKEIASAGIENLHLVDLSGAKQGKLVHTNVLSAIAKNTNLLIDFGGGVKQTADIQDVLNQGANQVVIGSLCVKEPEQVVAWIEQFGVERFVLALDTDGTVIKINGWQEASEKTLDEVMEVFARLNGLTILTTDIRRDGTGTGPSIDLYAELVKRYPNQQWIASGGVESLEDLQQLRAIGCYACVVGKALLEGKISLSTLKKFNDGSL